MKSREFVNYYFFEALDEIAGTHDVGFPLFPMKKHFPAYRVHSASNDYSDFSLSEAQPENCQRYNFMSHKGYNKIWTEASSMGKS